MRLADETGNRFQQGTFVLKIGQDNVRPFGLQGFHPVRASRDGNYPRAAVPAHLHVAERIADEDGVSLAESRPALRGRSFLRDSYEISTHLIIGTVSSSLEIEVFVKPESPRQPMFSRYSNTSDSREICRENLIESLDDKVDLALGSSE